MFSYYLCVCVCLLSVQAVAFECIDLKTLFLAWWYILTIYRLSLSIKVIGSKSFLSQTASFWTSIMKREVGLRLKCILVYISFQKQIQLLIIEIFHLIFGLKSLTTPLPPIIYHRSKAKKHLFILNRSWPDSYNVGY